MARCHYILVGENIVEQVVIIKIDPDHVRDRRVLINFLSSAEDIVKEQGGFIHSKYLLVNVNIGRRCLGGQPEKTTAATRCTGGWIYILYRNLCPSILYIALQGAVILRLV